MKQETEREKLKKQGKMCFLQRYLSMVLLAAVLAVQVAGCGNTQTTSGDSQSESAESETETASGDTGSETDETTESETEEVSEPASEEASEPATDETDTASEDAAEESSGSASEESNGADADTEDSAAASEASDAGTSTAEELTCQLLYEAVAAQAADGIAMVTVKDECTFLTSKYRELLEDFYYATDPEQVYCACIVKADSEDSAQTIKAEFDDALLSMQNDMYLTTDEQKVAKAGVTGISGQYVWYISLSDDTSVMSAAEDALLSKLG